jgi:hypothetical protein
MEICTGFPGEAKIEQDRFAKAGAWLWLRRLHDPRRMTQTLPREQRRTGAAGSLAYALADGTAA